MQATYEIEHCVIKSVSQTHSGELEVIKTYTLPDGDISKKEVYSAIEGKVTLTRVEDV